MTEAVLYFCPQMESLARRICEQDKRIQPAKINWQSFADGNPNISIHKVENGRKKRGAFLASFDAQEEYFRQLSTIYWLPDYGSIDLKVLMPYFPGQFDRAKTQSSVVTAKTLAMALSAAPPVEYVIYDIHSLHSANYFNKQFVRTRLKTGTKYLKKVVADTDVAICMPDKGGFERFGMFFDGSREGDRKFDMGWCEKDRLDATGRKVKIVSGDFRGRHVIVVDDIVQGGGTMLACKDALLAAGASEVSCYATHWVCPNESYRRFVDSGFANVWFTDSFPKTADKLVGLAQFKLISLAQSLTRVILNEDDEADDYERP